MRSRFTHLACGVVAVLAIASCGGDDKSGGGAVVTSDTGDTSAPTSGATETTEIGFDDSYERGPVGIRVVNLLDQDVDIYVRTSGLVQAYLVAGGVPPGVATEFYNPPPEGELVVTTTRSGDAPRVAPARGPESPRSSRHWAPAWDPGSTRKRPASRPTAIRSTSTTSTTSNSARGTSPIAQAPTR